MLSRERIWDGIKGRKGSLPAVAPKDGQAWNDAYNGINFEMTRKGIAKETQLIRLTIWGLSASVLLEFFVRALGDPQSLYPRISGINNVTIAFWNAKEVSKARRRWRVTRPEGSPVEESVTVANRPPTLREMFGKGSR